MNKSLATNLIAGGCVVTGFLLPGQIGTIVLSVGMFALSGAITNWLAVHMLFEKIPGLYGSGVIPERFEDFKKAIHTLMMEQFFTEENVKRFFESHGPDGKEPGFDFAPVIEKLDLNPAFDKLVETIKESRFGGMLGMVGGEAALQPMREPFAVKMKSAFNTISHSETFQKTIREQMSRSEMSHEILEKVDVIVSKRLEELTPKMVKEIIQKMIHEHLGWLVVWGGVFGGLIGLIAAFVPK